MNFYKLPSKEHQDSYLASLMSLECIKQRRSRQVTEEATAEDSSDSSVEDEGKVSSKAKKFSHGGAFYYKVRVAGSGGSGFQDIPVCRNAFTSFHGITRSRLRTVQSSLTNSGKAPLERRGKHVNRPNQMPNEIALLVEDHVRSFKPRQSHYSIRDNPKVLYLPETLSIKAMHRMFLDIYQIAVPYKAFPTTVGGVRDMGTP